MRVLRVSIINRDAPEVPDNVVDLLGLDLVVVV
jgi:hypothetical protein